MPCITQFLEALFIILYRYVLYPLFQFALVIGAPFNNKISQGLKARKGLWPRLTQKVAGLGPGPRLLIHVSSVGEFLQTKPLLDEIRKRNPAYRFVLSYYSPSLEKWFKSNPSDCDVVECFPSDRLKDVRRFLNLVSPQALILSKSDLWPNFIDESHRLKIPIFLITASINPKSFRHRNRFGRIFYAWIYRRLTSIFAISEGDAQRFAFAAPNHPSILLAGDTRVDAVVSRREKSRLESNQALDIVNSLRQLQRPIIVIGSSWPADESLLLAALAVSVKLSSRRALWVWVPHEVNPLHLTQLELALTKMKHRSSRWTDLTTAKAAVDLASLDSFIVDELGQLATLYQAGQIAYVGAGPGGLHNIMEPAIWGLPVLFGPRFDNAPEAPSLIKIGAARSVRSAAELASDLNQLLDDPIEAQKLGLRGQKFLEKQAGSAAYCADEIVKKLSIGATP